MRQRTRSALLSLALLAVAPAAASADIQGTVVNPAGVPLPGVRVEATDADGTFADSATTDANGTYTLESSSLSGDPAPYTLEFERFDQCRTSGEESTRRINSGPIADGATQNATLDVFDMCQGFQPSGSPTAAGLVEREARRILVPPGGAVYVEALLASDASGMQVVLQDGTVVGGANSGDNLGLIAPATGYEGPLFLRYTSNGAAVQRSLGTLIARAIGTPAPVTGPVDLNAIVDISGSMSGNDPNFIRKDAVRLLIDLATPGDRIGAVAFDDQLEEIFGMTTITGSRAVSNPLKALADQKIVNDGGTNYNAGFDGSIAQLTGPGIDPNRPKSVIFLTDGGHNSGEYANGHLRMAYNASGRPWPVCAIQLGPAGSFQTEDVARLKRIAAETGGQYFAAASAADLTSVYFRCFGRTTGERTLLNKAATYRQGQQRTFRKRISRGTKETTFFVGWGNGKYAVTLRDPNGKRRTGRRPGKGGTFRQGKTYAFYRVRNPKAGRWSLQVKARRLPTGRDRARTTITAPPRR